MYNLDRPIGILRVKRGISDLKILVTSHLLWYRYFQCLQNKVCRHIIDVIAVCNLAANQTSTDYQNIILRQPANILRFIHSMIM